MKKKIDYFSLSFAEEKKIAIKMWREIKLKMVKHPTWDVSAMKADFISKTFIMDDDDYQRFVWYNDCILCEYSRNCDFCPLRLVDDNMACMDTFSAYSMANNKSMNMDARLEACDRIIEAIKLLEKPEEER